MSKLTIFDHNKLKSPVKSECVLWKKKKKKCESVNKAYIWNRDSLKLDLIRQISKATQNCLTRLQIFTGKSTTIKRLNYVFSQFMTQILILN